jgi:predicted transcriptional regulator
LKKITTIRLDPDLWRRVKVRAAQEDKDAQDILAEALKAYLTKKKKGGRHA